jgi:hypothetical protein
MHVVLILGCWGREVDGFVCCNGVSNEILDITKNSERNIKMAEFFDKAYELFDKPLYSNVHTVIWTIQDKFSSSGNLVFSEKMFKFMEEFCISHKKCGIYLRLDIKK